MKKKRIGVPFLRRCGKAYWESAVGPRILHGVLRTDEGQLVRHRDTRTGNGGCLRVVESPSRQPLRVRGGQPVNNFPTMPRAAAGLPVPCTRLLATSIPRPRWEDHRQPRLNGDTRRRKRRLREKLAKLDAIRYAPAIRAAAAEMTRRVMDKIEREIFANPTLQRSVEPAKEIE